MKHIMLIKLIPGTDPVEIQERIFKTFRKLDDELDWLNRPVIVRACEDTDSSFDLMASFELDSEAQVETYLAHPLTEKLRSKVTPFVADKATFNHY
ncbi:MAG: Dabb family protein [Clostridia bacterium]|nr:Dabb family protein [Clostridia bacterium]